MSISCRYRQLIPLASDKLRSESFTNNTQILWPVYWVYGRYVESVVDVPFCCELEF